MKEINYYLPWNERWKERVSCFDIGDLIKVVSAVEQPVYIKQLSGQLGIIVEHPSSQGDTTFKVLINEEIYVLHVLDMEPVR